jgi:hypothetical protein
MASRGLPRHGVRVLEGHKSRLVREVYPDGETDDWTNLKGLEGSEDWKRAFIFIRVYAYQHDRDSSEIDTGRPGPPRWGHGHLYVFEARFKNGLGLAAEGLGRTNDEAWDDLLSRLRKRGLIPEGAS